MAGYVNVRTVRNTTAASATAAKGKQPQHYKNVKPQKYQDEQSDGYQIVQEQGLDSNSEYTDLTINKPMNQVDPATLQRENVIRELLFPPQKNTQRRFNYTDIKLDGSKSVDEESDVVSVHAPSEEEEVKIQPKPRIKPKPPKKSRKAIRMKTEDEERRDEVVEVAADVGPMPGRNKWKSRSFYLLLLGVSIIISLVAVVVAVVALTGSCEKIITDEDCTISNAHNCTTPPIEVTAAEVVSTL